MKRWAIPTTLALGAGLALSGADSAATRSLQSITDGGALTLCAHPNALPYANRRGEPPGLQIEIAEALAARLGVALNRNWVLNSYQLRRAGCDIILDAIGDKAALSEFGLRPSRPYHRSGVMLAVAKDLPVSALSDLAEDKRIGVQVGSLASMKINQGGHAISPFMFEEDILDALGKGEIPAAAVTPAAIGWFNRQHPDAQIKGIAAFDGDPDLSWNVGVGMMSPDDKLQQSIDTALSALLTDGTIAKIYARYGIAYKAPE